MLKQSEVCFMDLSCVFVLKSFSLLCVEHRALHRLGKLAAVACVCPKDTHSHLAAKPSRLLKPLKALKQ